MPQPIRIWEFRLAPEALRNLSEHGGDEDWVAELPPHYAASPPHWIERLGLCDVSEHDHPNKPGWKVYIGAHA